jgi:hypothetical protein
MPRKQRLSWTVVLWFAVVVTGFASLVVLGGGTRQGMFAGVDYSAWVHYRPPPRL